MTTTTSNEAPAEAPGPDRESVEEARMSFVEHLAELRLRLRNAALVFIVAVGVSFYFVKTYFVILTLPVGVVFTSMSRRLAVRR